MRPPQRMLPDFKNISLSKEDEQSVLISLGLIYYIIAAHFVFISVQRHNNYLNVGGNFQCFEYIIGCFTVSSLP